MKRIVWGIILLVFSVIFVIISFTSADEGYNIIREEAPGVIVMNFLIFSITGAFLIYFGKKSVNKNKRILESSLQMLRESKSIDSKKIAEDFKTSVIKIKRILIDGQIKGIIPLEAELK